MIQGVAGEAQCIRTVSCILNSLERDVSSGASRCGAPTKRRTGRIGRFEPRLGLGLGLG